MQAGRATRGVVPFENSTYGPVSFTLDGLADRDGTYADLAVCAEVYKEVQHYLLGRRQAQADNDDGSTTSFAHVRRVYSHPQAFGQCTDWLGRSLGGAAVRTETSSTSKAAELAAQDGSGRTAAIASPHAARVYGLDVLAERIENYGANFTRFFVLRR